MRFYVEKNLAQKYICGEKMTNIRSAKPMLLFVALVFFCVCLPPVSWVLYFYIQDGEWTLGISLILGKQFHIFEIPLLTFWNNFAGGESEMGLFSTNKEGNFQKIRRAAL